MKQRDMAGVKINFLTGIRAVKNLGGRYIWLWKCDCGAELETRISSVTRKINPQKSCRKCFYGRNTTHGKSKSKEFYAWRGMLSRCSNVNDEAYPNYGGRGILVCTRWANSFQNFLDDMGTAPSKSHSIDRINNELGYSKENCRWATPSEQVRNRRISVRIEFNGLKLLLPEWADIVKIKYRVLYARYRRNWAAEKILTTPYKPRR